MQEPKVNSFKAHYTYLIHHTELIQRNAMHISIETPP